MVRHLVEHYSGDMDVYNTPVLVCVRDEDVERFVDFLVYANTDTWETLRESDPAIFSRYFMVDTHVLWPADVFTQASYDDTPTKPAKLLTFHVVTD